MTVLENKISEEVVKSTWVVRMDPNPIQFGVLMIRRNLAAERYRGRRYEDTGGWRPSASQGERLQRNQPWLRLTCTFSVLNGEKINFCCSNNSGCVLSNVSPNRLIQLLILTTSCMVCTYCVLFKKYLLHPKSMNIYYGLFITVFRFAFLHFYVFKEIVITFF